MQDNTCPSLKHFQRFVLRGALAKQLPLTLQDAARAAIDTTITATTAVSKKTISDETALQAVTLTRTRARQLGERTEGDRCSASSFQI